MLNLIYFIFNNSSYNVEAIYNARVGIKYSNKKVLNIPKIGLNLYIKKANDNFSNLNKNIVYYKTFNPQDKIIIFGHSGVGYSTYFNRLDELKKEDIASICYENACYEYILNNTYIVNSNAVYLLNEEPNSKKLLLITCDKKNKNKRLVAEFIRKSVKTIEK